MKNIIITISILLLTSLGYALPVGNPADASILHDGVIFSTEDNCGCVPWSFRVGYWGDFVFDHKLKMHEHNRHKAVEKSRVITNAGLIVLNLWNRCDFFGTFGATHIFIKGFGRIFAEPQNQTREIETETNFSWSLGIRGTIVEWRCFALGIEGQYFRTRPLLNYTRQLNDSPEYDLTSRVRYREWQIGAGVSYLFTSCDCSSGIVPYAAFKWERARFSFGDVPVITGGTIFDMKNRRDWGYAIGFTLFGSQRWSLTLEGRFVNETAAHLNGQVRF